MNGNNCLRQFLWFLWIWEIRYLSELLLTHLKQNQIVIFNANYRKNNIILLLIKILIRKLSLYFKPVNDIMEIGRAHV